MKKKKSLVLAIALFSQIGCSGNFGGMNLKDMISSAGQIGRAFNGFSSTEEYQIGRTTSAKILGRYTPSQGKENNYIQKVGALLAAHSDMPETYGGYHFQVLKGNEVNAFSTPGGFVFITEGMLKLAENEDELAAVLAHEIAHINLAHGTNALRQQGFTSVATKVGIAAMKPYGNQWVSAATSLLEDRASLLLDPLITKGYSRSQEYDADEYAVQLLTRTGYNPQAFVRVLEKMKAQESKASGGIFSTHPSTEDRLTEVRDVIDSDHLTAGTDEDVRTARYKRMI